MSLTYAAIYKKKCNVYEEEKKNIIRKLIILNPEKFDIKSHNLNIEISKNPIHNLIHKPYY